MNIFLTFSDSAKYADIAKNIINGFGYGSFFSFWSSKIFDLIKSKIFYYSITPPLTPVSIAIFYKIFGVNDFAVVATSGFYFLLTLIFVYLLAKNIFKSKLTGVLSTLAVGFNYDLIHYASSGASESPFIFEIVAGLYFLTLKKKWANVLTFVFLILMYFTRPQAFIYIAGIILFWLLINFKTKRALIYFIGTILTGVLIDYFVLRPLSGKYFIYSILGRGLASSFNQSSTASDVLRGGTVVSGGINQVLKNVLYNLYNFYKAIPAIINPYLFGIFTIGLLLKSKSKEIFSFKVASVFMVCLTLLVTAASIPFYRYIHPVIPLVYVIAVGTLVEITKEQIANYKQFTLFKSQLTKNVLLAIASCCLVFFLGVGQTLGILLLDSRFEKNIHNTDKPPVYVLLSYILRDNTNKNDIVLTNLDTWGSWYGERKTVWFPLEPNEIIEPVTGTIPFDAIYLTSYKIDDQNYYMGTSWRLIFDNPENSNKWTCSGCSEIAKEFTLKDVYRIKADGNYERQDAKAILLIKK